MVTFATCILEAQLHCYHKKHCCVQNLLFVRYDCFSPLLRRGHSVNINVFLRRVFPKVKKRSCVVFIWGSVANFLATMFVMGDITPPLSLPLIPPIPLGECIFKCLFCGLTRHVTSGSLNSKNQALSRIHLTVIDRNSIFVKRIFRCFSGYVYGHKSYYVATLASRIPT